MKKGFYQPQGAMLEITSLCNLNCAHCYNSSGNGNKGREISDDGWMIILDKILEYPLTGILFTGGEPFMRENLMRKMLIKISNYPCTEIFINTNGQRISKEFIDFLLNIPNPKTIQVSIDGAFPHLHDKVRRVEGSWEKAVRSCLQLANLPIKLRIAHTINKLNVDYIDEMIQMAIFLEAELLGMGVAVPLGRGSIDEEKIILPLSERVELHSKLNAFKEKYEKYIDLQFTSPGGNDYYTWYLEYCQDWLLVNSEGNVKLENRLPFLVGSLLNESVEDIWNKVNYFQDSNEVADIIQKSMRCGIELDNQKHIML